MRAALRRHWFSVRAVGLTALALTAALGVGACSASPAATTVTAAPVPATATWQSSAKLGLWRTEGFDVFNNEWNKAEAGPQTIWAHSYHSWGVRSSQPATSSVKTYPCVQRNFSEPHVASITHLISSYAQTMPPVAVSYDAEAAFDLWLNSFKTEVMLWVDNHGQTPSGNVIGQAVISGRPYDVYEGNAQMFSFVISGRPEPSGTVDLLSALRWLMGRGYLRGSDVLTQVNFGWEIASTGGTPLDFTLTKFTLATNVK